MWGHRATTQGGEPLHLIYWFELRARHAAQADRRVRREDLPAAFQAMEVMEVMEVLEVDTAVGAHVGCNSLKSGVGGPASRLPLVPAGGSSLPRP